jgi:hypothetical protein
VSRARRSDRRPVRGGLSYRAAGVDIDAGEEAVRRLAPWARATYRPEVLGDIGAFAAFFRAPRRYRQPVFVASTDGVRVDMGGGVVLAVPAVSAGPAGRSSTTRGAPSRENWRVLLWRRATRYA